MSKPKATVTISGGGKSVTLDADTLARVAKQASAAPAKGTQRSFGFDTTHGFLGEEFLTWLWFRWETQGGEFTLAGGRVVSIAIDDLLAFAAMGEDESQQTIRHGLPTRTPEARTGLRQGHRLAKARLLIAEGSRQWSLVLDGERMAFSSVRGPEDSEDCESAEDRTGDRVANWLALYGIVEALFGQFLRVRLAADWRDGEAARMADWMAS